MTIRWILCLAVSFVGHAVWLMWQRPLGSGSVKAVKTTVRIIEEQQSEVQKKETREQQHDKAIAQEDIDFDKIAESLPEPTFRPNVEQEQEIKEVNDVVGTERSEDVAAERVDSVSTIAEPKPMSAVARQKEIVKYRRELLDDFDDSWQKVPELNTTISNVSQLPEIDRHYGIKVLAYGFVDQKPAGPFVVFASESDGFEKADMFDFSGYSNRVKDRMLSIEYQRRLDLARKEYGLGSRFMKIIGLIPAKVDRYFAAKQVRAIALSGIVIDEVRSTNAHYERDGLGGFNLIVDSVECVDGSVVRIKDEELRYCVVASR